MNLVRTFLFAIDDSGDFGALGTKEVIKLDSWFAITDRKGFEI